MRGSLLVVASFEEPRVRSVGDIERHDCGRASVKSKAVMRLVSRVVSGLS